MIRLVYLLGLVLAAWLAALFPPPSPPYVGPADKSSGPGNKPIRRVVIHSTVSGSGRGVARAIAAYFRSDRAGGSAHYVVDAYETVQVVFDSIVAWHAPPNPHTIGVEMCDDPGPIPAEGERAAARKRWRWLDPLHVLLLRRTAKLTAQLCLAYGLPIRMLDAGDLRANPDAEGITTHDYTSQAFRQSSHWDPGFWPERRFVKLTRRYAASMTRAAERDARKRAGKRAGK